MELYLYDKGQLTLCNLKSSTRLVRNKEKIEASADHGNMSGIFEDKNRMWRLGTRLWVLALDLVGVKYETSERAKRAPSASQTWDVKFVGLGIFRADSERVEGGEIHCSAALRIGKLIRSTAGYTAEGG